MKRIVATPSRYKAPNLRLSVSSITSYLVHQGPHMVVSVLDPRAILRSSSTLPCGAFEQRIDVTLQIALPYVWEFVFWKLDAISSNQRTTPVNEMGKSSHAHFWGPLQSSHYCPKKVRHRSSKGPEYASQEHGTVKTLALHQINQTLVSFRLRFIRIELLVKASYYWRRKYWGKLGVIMMRFARTSSV